MPKAFGKLTSIEPAYNEENSSRVHGDFTESSYGNGRIQVHLSEAHSAIVFNLTSFTAGVPVRPAGTP
jgi:hypothetical protein